MDSLSTDRSITINSLFDNFFEVAEFQREYVWLTDDVSELLEGIWKSFKKDPDQPYFIGSIVLSAVDNNKYHIVDGQQRLTTLFLALCGMKARIKGLNPESEEIQLIDNKLRFLYFDKKKKGTTKEFRIKPLNEHSQDIIDIAFEGGMINFETEDNSSQHLKEAYNTCNDFYKLYIKDKNQANDFLEYVLHRVCVLPYVASSMSHAITVFETLNSTGKGLTPVDLVKNILFRESDQSNWEDLQDRWKEFLDILESTQEQPQRFLKYFILVTYGKPVTDSEVFNWIRENPKLTKINRDVFAFLDLLINFADAYRNIMLGRFPDGTANPNISNLKKLASRARQHFPFLIAIKNFPKDRADKFITATESILVAYGIQRMYTGDIESTFSKWTIQARNCESKKEIDNFYQKIVDPDVKNVGGSALGKLRTLNEFSIAKQKLVYLLCRLDSYLQTYAESGSMYRDISTSYKGYDIEHVMPRSATQYDLFGFTEKEDFERYKHSIGNLTILEKALNRAIQDKPFVEKKDSGYQHSSYLLTRGIAVSLGGSSQLAKALGSVQKFAEWDKAAIEARQNNLCDIAAKAFGWKL